MRCFLLFLMVIFWSCSNPLENMYNKMNLENDLIELKSIISEEELNELLKYILISESLGVDINGKSYNELLKEIKISEINKKNRSYLSDDIRGVINERLDHEICDEFILEMHKKENRIHISHEDEKNDWVR